MQLCLFDEGTSWGIAYKTTYLGSEVDTLKHKTYITQLQSLCYKWP